MSKPTEVAAVWTATGQFLTRIDHGPDLSDEQRIDDVVTDDWIYPSDRSIPHTTDSELAPAGRRDDVVV